MQNKHDEVAKKDDYIMYCDKYKKGTGIVLLKKVKVIKMKIMIGKA